MIRILIGVGLSFLLSGCANPKVQPLTIASPPARTDLLGCWVGIAEGDLFVYRVCLTSNGGVLGKEYREREMTSDRISSWRLDGFELELVTDASPKTKIRKITALVQGDILFAKAFGSDWAYSFVLMREDKFNRRVERLRNHMGGGR